MNFVLKTSPSHTATNVPLDARLEVHFMVDMNINTLLDNVVLFNVDDQRSEPVECEYKNRYLLIQPKSKMEPLRHYQVQLVGGNDGMMDITGRRMPASYTFEFYTADVKGIKAPILTSPTDQSVRTNKNVKFSWEAVEGAYYYELEISKSNTFDVIEWPKSRIRIFEQEIIPDISYAAGNYYARVRSVKNDGTRSAYSDPVQFYYSEDNEEIVEVKEPKTEHGSNEPSLTAPNASDPSPVESLQQILSEQATEPSELNVVKMSPSPDSLHLAVTQVKEIVLEFDEAIDPDSLEWIYVVSERN